MGHMLLAALLVSLLQNPAPEVELVESAPLETTLDHADLRNADVVWLDMIGRAKTSLDFAEFYASNQAGSKLEPIVQALESAATRGVHVRFLAEEKFYKTYPETLERLAATKGIEMRRWNVAKDFGGILHAKYFVMDAAELYVGSQNFDWRSLDHIVELGLRVRAPESARAFQAVFDADWAIAGGAKIDEALVGLRAKFSFPEKVGDLALTPRFSPLVGVPDESWWELPQLVALLDGAKQTVRVEVLTYKTIGRDKQFWSTLEDALRRAAARGVKVRMLVADWSKRAGTIEGLQSLEPLANVEVKLVTIPPFSGGHVPFGRVAHAKFAVVDGEHTWIGTSNWERDYFEQSRNACFFVDGASLAVRLEQFFDELWSTPYAYAVDPGAKYEVPKIGD